MWEDSRLTWDPASYGGLNKLWNNHKDTSGIKDTDIWMPDTFFATAVGLDKSLNAQGMQLNASGYVITSSLFELTNTCAFHGHYYPFDKQVCLLLVETYLQQPQDISLVLPYAGDRWTQALEVVESADAESSTHTVGEFKMTAAGATVSETTLGGYPFPQIKYTLRFSRFYMRYFATTFVPLWLVSILSLLSHFIDPTATPARVGLGVTTVLVLVSLMITLTRAIPAVGETYALDFYFLVCYIMVMGGVMEYTLANWVLVRLRRASENLQRRQDVEKHMVKAAKDAGSMAVSVAWQAATKSPLTPRGRCTPVDNEPIERQDSEPVPHATLTSVGDIGGAAAGAGLMIRGGGSTPDLFCPTEHGAAGAASPRLSPKSEEKWQEAGLKEMFYLFDEDRDGHVSMKEFAPTIARVTEFQRQPLSQAQIMEHVWNSFSKDKEELSIEEFMECMEPLAPILLRSRQGMSLVCGKVWTRHTVSMLEKRYAYIAAACWFIFNVAWFGCVMCLSDSDAY